MSSNEAYEYSPQFDRLMKLLEDELDLAGVRLLYNELADELVVFLFGDIEHTVAIDVSNYQYLLVDPETEQVVGFQFDDFMGKVVPERPRLLTLASLAGVDEATIAEARDRIGQERSREALLHSALRDLFEEAPTGS